jgi:hypothetical protein
MQPSSQQPLLPRSPLVADLQGLFPEPLQDICIRNSKRVCDRKCEAPVTCGVADIANGGFRRRPPVPRKGQGGGGPLIWRDACPCASQIRERLAVGLAAPVFIRTDIAARESNHSFDRTFSRHHTPGTGTC